jgi:hypothetical protein
MKRLNHFLDTAHSFKVFLFGWALSGGVVFILFASFSTVESSITIIKSAEIGILGACPFAWMFSFLTMELRRSKKFWEYFSVVDELIDKAETKYDLDMIFDNEFKTLKTLARGGSSGIQYQEIIKLYNIMKTKYKYVK